ncbi:unnamed protein product (mitochondrion) [Plasmodiophora brassicae]|uniref:MoaB/Mog domain-containing protein n=2 Tax=Plasmodiophora brassicae TaxID=37360 RepID=A0A3P3YNY8_PLABS|nr:unnamed protein product [Plasmodiophora brassicae]
MVEMDDAIAAVLDVASRNATRGVERVALGDALGRRASADVRSPVGLPEWPTSMMDGYAVVSADGPGVYTVVDEITAGRASDAAALRPGQVAYITTGAAVPRGADAVVMVEKTAPGPRPGTVEVCVASDPGTFVRDAASDMAEGDLLVAQSCTVTASEIAMLAAAGVGHIDVYSRVRVGVASTGDEIARGIVRDSNRPMLMAMLSQLRYVQVVDCGVVADDEASVRDLFADAVSSLDMLVTTGGVSMGSHDLVKPTLGELGTVHFGRLRMRPGKPTTFATIPRRSATDLLVLALPGNPVSAFVTCELLVLQALSALAHGQSHPVKLQCRIDTDIKCDPERMEYHRAVVRWDPASRGLVASSTGRQCSSRITSLAGANALLCVPSQRDPLSSGSIVDALLIGPIEASQRRPISPDVSSSSEQSNCPHHHKHSRSQQREIRVAVLTCSDRVCNGAYEDRSGPAAVKFLQSATAAKFIVTAADAVPDELDEIRSRLIQFSSGPDPVSVVFTLGGTGLSSRDVTPDATVSVVHRQIPAITTAMQIEGRKHTPHAILSRAVAGVRDKTLIVNLVGSPSGVVENLEAIVESIPHAVALLSGS